MLQLRGKTRCRYLVRFLVLLRAEQEVTVTLVLREVQAHTIRERCWSICQWIVTPLLVLWNGHIVPWENGCVQ